MKERLVIGKDCATRWDVTLGPCKIVVGSNCMSEVEWDIDLSSMLIENCC